MNLLEEIVSKIPTIEPSVNYWLLRTDSGRLYKSFIDKSVVTIGYSGIDTKFLATENFENEKSQKRLSDLIKNEYPDHERPGLIVSQLIRFVHEIRKGDIVLIPSSSSDKLAIGIIEDNDLYDISHHFISRGKVVIDPEFKKSRKVKWIKEIPKREYNSKLLQLIFSHQTIVNANDYSDWIDPLLHDFFVKDNKYHLVLNVKRKEKIIARELFGACIELFDISDIIVNELEIDDNSTIVDSKINLNSPGSIELLSAAPYIIAAIGLLVILVNGGSFKIKIEKLGFDLNIGSDGLIKKINDFLNSKKDRKLKETVKEQIKSLDIQSTEEICRILETINEKNQND